MEELKAMISTISRSKVKQIEVISNQDGGNTQTQQLYDGIARGEIQTDEDIVAAFFADSGENTSFYVSRIKRKLKDKLVNTLFFIDVNRPNFNDHNRAYFTCYRQVAAVKILIGLGTREAAIPIAEKTLKQAEHFGFTELIYSLAKDIRRHYGSIEGDRKKFEDYNSIVIKSSKILEAETIAEQYYTDLIIYYIKSRATNVEAKEKAIKYSNELELLMKKVSSPRFNFLAYLIFTSRHEIENNYTATQKVCEQAIKYFSKIQDKVPIGNIYFFALKKLACHIYLSNYSGANKAVDKCLEFSREGTVNWFLTWEYALILNFHVKNFQKAYDIYKKVVSHSDFNKLPSYIKEHWYVYEAYTYYFIFTKKIKPEKDNPTKKFRLSKFLNEVPEHSKDKRGANISIIILQILFFLHQQKYNDIIDRVESLKTYTYRYLRRDDTFRSSCFIKMLMTVPDASFHKKAVLRRAEKYRKRLAEVPLHKANQSAELEVVPYETLWEMVLAELDEDWH